MSLYLPLRNTLVPTIGVGSPTFTRATVASVTDFEGLLKTAKAGEIRFEGARRVENLCTKSESSVGTSLSTTGNLTVVDTIEAGLPETCLNSIKITLNLINASHFFRQGITTVSGDAYSIRCYAKKGTHRYFGLRIATSASAYLTFDFDTGTFVAETSNYQGYGAKSVGNGWWLLWAKQTNPAIGAGQVLSFNLPNNLGAESWSSAGTETAYVTGIVFEKITGQANQNPADYVSAGVLSAPYHGAGADGVKYFTTQNGNTVSSNVVTEATGTTIPEATLKGAMIEAASTNLFLQSAILATQNVTTTATTYTVSFTGTGTVTLSGTYTGSLVGTGANNRVSLSFTATNGTLTATVSGTCTKGQCEAKPMATSYIPTTGSTATRNADVFTFPNAGNVSNTSGTVLVDCTPAFDIPNSSTSAYGNNYLIDFGSVNGYIGHAANQLKRYDGTTEILSPAWIPLKNTTYKIGSRYGSAGQRNWLNGTAGTNGSFDGSINSATNMTIGATGTGLSYWGGTIKNLKIYKKALSDAQIVEAQKIYLVDEAGTQLFDEFGTTLFYY